MPNHSHLYAALTVLVLGLPVAAHAAKHDAKSAAADVSAVKSLGGTGSWEAYADDASGGKICYLIGKPKEVNGVHAKPDEVRMSVTHRPADKVENVVNFILGFRAKKGSDATLDIDGKNFPLFTDRGGAWTRDAATDRAVVIALTRGREAVIKAEPERGKPIADSYDLSGFTASVALIDKACGIRR